MYIEINAIYFFINTQGVICSGGGGGGGSVYQIPENSDLQYTLVVNYSLNAV